MTVALWGVSTRSAVRPSAGKPRTQSSAVRTNAFMIHAAGGGELQTDQWRGVSHAPVRDQGRFGARGLVGEAAGPHGASPGISATRNLPVRNDVSCPRGRAETRRVS